MTISELAKELGVSRGTVYNLLDKAGISVNDLTEKKQGNRRLLTDYGQKTVRNLLLSVNSADTVNRLNNALETAEETVKALTVELETYKTTNEKLTAELERAREDLDRKTEKHAQDLQAASDQHEQDQITIDRLMGTIEAQNATIQAQAMTAAAQTATIQAMQQRLPAAPQTLRQAIAGWISSKRKGS